MARFDYDQIVRSCAVKADSLALIHLEAEHTRQFETGREDADRRQAAERQVIRDELRELRAEVRELKRLLMKGSDQP